ncbi:MAG: hypothetical protein HC866_20480 [Leptolyngbyaceae cyanobacterium RU_5_1]|nr:hypothetical protein [Leptolyngbyaceae cyanobacterium RU_5_1]
MSSVDKSSGKPVLSVQLIVLIEIVWAVLALLFFLLFSVTPQGQERPFWYSLGTSILEATSFLAAAALCFRNWSSPQIVSGRNVWLGIGLGMSCYFIGNLLFSYWELGLGLEPDVSPGDFFFILTYIFLLWGMMHAVVPRRLNLEVWQKGIVFAIAVVGIAIAAVLFAAQSSENTTTWLESPAYAQTAPATPSTQSSPNMAPSPNPAPVMAPTANPPAANAKLSTSTNGEQKPTPPKWATDLATQLQFLKKPVTGFYIVCDVLLLLLATALLLAFWGGRFSQSWRMIAAAAFSLYIADIWFQWASNAPNYKSGSLPEVFWVFSGVLFGIGAALEYDLSSRSRRSGSRRRA